MLLSRDSELVIDKLAIALVPVFGPSVMIAELFAQVLPSLERGGMRRILEVGSAPCSGSTTTNASGEDLIAEVNPLT